MKPSVWRDRAAHSLSCYLGVATSKKEFDAALKHIKCVGEWEPGKAGKVITYYNETTDKTVALVAIDVGVTSDPAELIRTVVHEATHVWQIHERLVGGSQRLCDEYEAYTIENIFATIFAAVVPVWQRKLRRAK